MVLGLISFEGFLISGLGNFAKQRYNASIMKGVLFIREYGIALLAVGLASANLGAFLSNEGSLAQTVRRSWYRLWVSGGGGGLCGLSVLSAANWGATYPS